MARDAYRKTPTLRYFYDNPAYSYSDAIFLYGMSRHLQPKRIVEVGSGHSSCVMLDTADLHLGGRVAFTFVEPYPATLLALLWPADLDRVTILESGVQDVGSAFLTFNDTFEIVLFNTYLERFHRDFFDRNMPLCLRNEGGSIWLRRVR